MVIEERIKAVTEHASNVAALCETTLAGRIVYFTRARVLHDAISGVVWAMDQIERQATPSDFNDDWRDLRLRLAQSQTRFQRIIAGADAPQHPCRPTL